MPHPTIAEQVLNTWGATTTLVPTSAKEESDWLATLGGCRLLIEEKTKYEDPITRRERLARLNAGEIVPTTTPLTHDNRLSGIVRKAAGQLRSSGTQIEHDLRVLWFTAIGRDAEAKHLQLIATLYGTTKIYELHKGGITTCYFFRNSDFFRYSTEIDGAVVGFVYGSSVTLKLCLNPHSNRWQALRDSPFAHQIPNGLIDPVAEEAADAAYLANTDIDRKDSGAVLAYLQSKYNTGPLTNMDMGFSSVSLSLSGEL